MLTYTLKIGISKKFGGRTVSRHYTSYTCRNKVFLARPLVVGYLPWPELRMALTADAELPVNRWWKRGLGITYDFRKQTLRFHKDRSK